MPKTQNAANVGATQKENATKSTYGLGINKLEGKNYSNTDIKPKQKGLAQDAQSSTKDNKAVDKKPVATPKKGLWSKFKSFVSKTFGEKKPDTKQLEIKDKNAEATKSKSIKNQQTPTEVTTDLSNKPIKKGLWSKFKDFVSKRFGEQRTVNLDVKQPIGAENKPNPKIAPGTRVMSEEKPLGAKPHPISPEGKRVAFSTELAESDSKQQAQNIFKTTFVAHEQDAHPDNNLNAPSTKDKGLIEIKTEASVARAVANNETKDTEKTMQSILKKPELTSAIGQLKQGIESGKNANDSSAEAAKQNKEKPQLIGKGASGGRSV